MQESTAAEAPAPPGGSRSGGASVEGGGAQPWVGFAPRTYQLRLRIPEGAVRDPAAVWFELRCTDISDEARPSYTWPLLRMGGGGGGGGTDAAAVSPP
jgi:hypothetical protein